MRPLSDCGIYKYFLPEWQDLLSRAAAFQILQAAAADSPAQKYPVGHGIREAGFVRPDPATELMSHRGTYAFGAPPDTADTAVPGKNFIEGGYGAAAERLCLPWPGRINALNLIRDPGKNAILSYEICCSHALCIKNPVEAPVSGVSEIQR